MKIARLFDGTNTAGEPIYASRAIISDREEIERIDNYLSGGEFILHTAARLHDLLSESTEQVVPVSYATDGVWIWSIAIGYYLQHHGIAPEDDFLRHIEKHNYTITPPDERAISEAAAYLEEYFASPE